MSTNPIGRWTPYDSNYPTCEETRAKLLIYPPDEFDPYTITPLLGVTPTEVGRKGERRVNSLGLERIVPHNIWFLISEDYVPSKDLRHHLDWLLDKIEPASDQLKQLQQYPDMLMCISCVWWSAHGHGGPIMWPEHMKRMADLNLECGFDIYFFGDFII